MTKASRNILSKTAEVLNRHVAEGSPLGRELSAGTDVSRSMVGVVNEILRETAEGGTLVCATEIDGTLLGFVPRADVALPELIRGGLAVVPRSPEE